METLDIRDLNLKLATFGFLFYIVIFSVVDYLNIPYKEMANVYGMGLVLLNIALNILMAIMSSYLLAVNDALLKIKGIHTKGDNLSFGAVLFGILTYGCTPCVISFFASFGIAFSVTVLPMAGLPYKFVSVMLIVVGIVWTHFEMKRKACKIRIRRGHNDVF